MTDGPKRHDTEPTMPRPRTALAPVSARYEPTAEEIAQAVELSRELRAGEPTLDACPACESCALCHGTGVVEPEKAARYRQLAENLREDDDDAPGCP